MICSFHCIFKTSNYISTFTFFSVGCEGIYQIYGAVKSYILINMKTRLTSFSARFILFFLILNYSHSFSKIVLQPTAKTLKSYIIYDNNI